MGIAGQIQNIGKSRFPWSSSSDSMLTGCQIENTQQQEGAKLTMESDKPHTASWSANV